MNNENDSASIMIIEDDRDIALVMSRVLARNGYQSHISHSSHQLDEWLAENPDTVPDLFLLDLSLPRVNGRAIFERLRNSPRTAEVPVIIVSANEQVDKRVEMLNLGVEDYITKPFEFNELLARTTIQIQLSNLRREKRRAERKIAAQMQRMKAINNIAHEASRNIDLDRMLNQVVSAIATNFECAVAAVYLTNDAETKLRLAAQSHPVSLPVLCTDKIYAQLKQNEIVAFGPNNRDIAVPMLREDDVLMGCLMMRQTTEKSAEWVEDETALNILSTQLATAVANCYLFDDIQQRNKQLFEAVRQNRLLLKREKQQRQQAELLKRLAQAVNSMLDQDAVLDATLRNLKKLIQVERGSIVLVDEEKNDNTLRFAGLLDVKGDQKLKQMRIPANRGILGQVIRTGKPALVNDVQNHPHFYAGVEQQMTGDVHRSMLCVPLIAREQTLGAIQLLNKVGGPFNETHLRLVSSAANVVAVALDNARLYQKQRELLQELQISQEQLIQSEKLAATGRLAASLAHEINNPLQAIHSCLQLAIHFDLEPDKIDEYLGMADEEVERLVEIVNRVLNFARPSQSDFTDVDVNKVIEHVLQLVNKYVSHGNYKIEPALAAQLPQVHGVPDQIQQVFLNIMLNAFDAMPSGGTLMITTKTAEADMVEIQFTDTGEGIEERHLEKIFEPFYTTKNKQHGLGLAISYSIIEQHRGSIVPMSQKGYGSTFIVQFPTTPPDDDSI